MDFQLAQPPPLDETIFRVCGLRKAGAGTFFFSAKPLRPPARTHPRTQPHTTPESALDTTHELALTETGVPLSAFTRAAHNTAGPPRGVLNSRHR